LTWVLINTIQMYVHASKKFQSTDEKRRQFSLETWVTDQSEDMGNSSVWRHG
jgi:hypothetical protein